jgi:hypothetical protein
LRPIRRRLKRWTFDHLTELRDHDPTVPEDMFINDRAVDVWRPLLSIADVAGGDWPERARKAAVFLTTRAVESAPESEGAELLRNIHNLYYPGGTLPDGGPRPPVEVMSVALLCDKLIMNSEWVWATCNSGKPMTGNMLTKKLKNYRVKPEQKRLKADRDRAEKTSKDTRQRGFWREDLDRAFREFGIGPVRTPVSRENSRDTRDGRDSASQGADTAELSEAETVSQEGETARETAHETNGTTTHQYTDVNADTFITQAARAIRRQAVPRRRNHRPEPEA